MVLTHANGDSSQPRPRLAWLALLLWAVGCALPAPGQPNWNVDPTAHLTPLERLALDASFMVTPSSLHHPLQPVIINHVLAAFGSPDEHAQQVPQMFQRNRSNGRIPFVFIPADIRPRFRRDLVPVMLVGDLGLFTDRAVPVDIQRGVEQCIRAKAAQMPGGTFKLAGVPVALGGRDDLIRRLEQKDRERDEAAAKIRAGNLAEFPADVRQDKVFDYLGYFAIKEALGNRTLELSRYYPSPQVGPEDIFTSLRQQGKALVARGVLPFLYAPADTPKAALAGFPPIVRIGSWGVWGSPESPAADLQQLEKVLTTLLQDVEFREKAQLMGVEEFGNADDLRQLAAATQERKPRRNPPAAAAAVTAATAATATAAKVPAAKPARVVDAHGPPLTLDPGRGSQSSGPPIPPAIRSTKGGPEGWLPVSKEEKARHAKEQNDFKQRMAAKQNKIAELKKQRAREDAERQANNLKVFLAWDQQKKEEIAARDRRNIEKLRAAESRPDAVTATIEDVNGEPWIVLVNNTDVALYVEYSYTGTIEQKPLGMLGEGWTILTSGSYPYRWRLWHFSSVAQKRQSYQAWIEKIQWWAREQDNRWRN